MTRWQPRIVVKDGPFVSVHTDEVFLLPAEGVREAMAKLGLTEARKVFVTVMDDSPWLRLTPGDEHHLRVKRLDRETPDSMLYGELNNVEQKAWPWRIGERHPWPVEPLPCATYADFRRERVTEDGRFQFDDLARTPPRFWLEAVSDPTLSSTTLGKFILKSSWLPLWEALAANPAADLQTLASLASVAPEIVLENPALPLLLLMEPSDARLFPKGFLDQLDLHGAR